MTARETALAGAYVLEGDAYEDERGLFARTFCERDFVALGLDPFIAQVNLSLTHAVGTVRGLHFQYPPHAETKVVRCTRGAVFDVIVDLRPESPTFLEHATFELTAANRRSLYVPRRFAHGFQVLDEESELLYLMGEFYAPAHQGGLRWDDPRLAVAWPHPPRDMSERDRGWPLLDASESDLRERLMPAVD